MADKIHVFISYATKDATFVGRLREDLTRHGIAYWVDKEGLRPGTPNWEKGIRKGIQDAYAVIYVVTPNSYASEYVQGEIAVARMEGCAIFPAWLDGEWHNCVPIELVKSERVDVRGYEYERNRELLFDALRGKHPDLAVPPTMPAVLPVGVEPHNPYKGLNAFTEKDVADFFGRDALVNELIDAVKGRIVANQDRILTVIGASGSGKSSVVMAGLLPKLKSGAISGSAQWTYLKPMVPGNHPVESLVNLLLETPELNVSMDIIESDLRHPNGKGLHRLALKMPKHPVVLYIDQFEELYMTGVPEDQRQQFISLLTYAVTQPDSPLLVLLTLRADFYDRPLNDPELGRLMQSYNRSILPMTIADLLGSVEKPAIAAGLKFESGLVADIVFNLRDDKNAQAGALPLLQYTLEQLYERRTGNTLTSAAYQDIGGVKGAIGAHAEKVFLSLDEEAQSAFARVFQALVNVDEKGIPTRKREAESVLTSQPASTRLVEALIKRARVLRVYSEKLGETPYIEVAHEALLISWNRLANWIKSADNDLRLIQEMKAAASRWARDGYPTTDYLWSHGRLHLVYKALERLPQVLTSDEQSFIQPEAERLLEDYKNAPEHVQLTIVERDFARIGEAAVLTLLLAYGYINQSDQRFRRMSSLTKENVVQIAIEKILWLYPQNTFSKVQTVLTVKDKQIRKGIIRLIGRLALYKLEYHLLAGLQTDDIEIRQESAYALGKVANYEAIPALSIAIKDVDAIVREAAVGALMEIGHTSAIPVLLEALQDQDYSVRQAAAEVLGNFADTRAIPALLAILKTRPTTEFRYQDVRPAAVEALGKLGDTSVTPILLEILQDKDLSLRQAVISAVGKLRDRSAVPSLLNLLKDKEPRIRQATVEVLGELGDIRAIPALLDARFEDEATSIQRDINEALDKLRKVNNVRALINALKIDDQIRSYIVEAIGQLGDSTDIPFLLDALHNIDVSIRQAAVVALGNLGDKSVVSVLIDILQDQNKYIKQSAILALGQLGDKSAVPVILKSLQELDVSIRQSATQTLGRLGDGSIVSELINALQDSSPYVRRSAATALGQLKAISSVPALLSALQDIDVNVRQLSVRALGDIQANNLVLDLVEAYHSQAISVRRDIIESIGRLGDVRGIPTLLDALQSTDSAVRKAAVDALGTLGDLSTITVLTDILQHKDRNMRRASALALRRFRDINTIPALLMALKDEDSGVRRVVSETLCQFDDPRIVPALLDAIKDNDSKIREIVTQRLIEIADIGIVPKLTVILQDYDPEIRKYALKIIINFPLSQTITQLVELLDHPFGFVSKPVRQALELMDIPESRAALAEYDAKYKG